MIRLHGPRFWALASIFIGFAIAYPFLLKPAPPATQSGSQFEHGFRIADAAAGTAIEPVLNPGKASMVSAASWDTPASEVGELDEPGQQAYDSVPDIRQLPTELPEWVRPSSGLDQLLADSHRATKASSPLRKLKEPEPWIEGPDQRSTERADSVATFSAESTTARGNDLLASPFDRERAGTKRQSGRLHDQPQRVQELLANSKWPDQLIPPKGWREPDSQRRERREVENRNAIAQDFPRATNGNGSTQSIAAGTLSKQPVVRAPSITRKDFARGPGSLISVRPWQGSGPDDQRLPREENAHETERKRRFIYQPGFDPGKE